MTDGIPGELAGWYSGGRALDLKTARIQIDGQEQTLPIEPDAKGVALTLDLEAGVKRVQTFLSDGGDLSIGAYYVYVRRVE